MLQFGSKHVGIEDVHIFKHCHEMTGLLLWIGTYCISYVVQQTSRVNDLSSLVRYDDSCFAAIRHVQSIIRIVRPRPNIRSHSVLFIFETMFTIGESRAIFHSNDTGQQAQQVTGNPRFSTETPPENAD